MGRGSSKAGVAGGNVKNITQINSAGGLKALQKEAKGTPAEQWYNESGQNYDNCERWKAYMIYREISKRSEVMMTLQRILICRRRRA